MMKAIAHIMPIAVFAFLAAGSVDSSDSSGGSSDNGADANSIILGDYKFQDVTLRVVPSDSRSGYNFEFVGVASNNSKEEVTRSGALGYSIGVCAFAKIKDDQDREFVVQCSVPPLLPGETSKPVVFATSTALPGSKGAKLCMPKCSRLFAAN